MLDACQFDVSIIVPCFNSEKKLSKCLRSIKSQKTRFSYEAIFIDDCSTDSTVHLLREQCKNYSNWQIICLKCNSGSPSKPRNIGISKAKGRYIFFLDSDDEIAPDAIEIQVDLAINFNHDIVRSSMLVDKLNSIKTANKINEWDPYMPNSDRIKQILLTQTLTKSCFFDRHFLLSNSIYFDEKLRMGEDVLFVAEALSKSTNIGYLTHVSYTYHAQAANQDSTTSNFGPTELSNQLNFWPRMEYIFKSCGVSYHQTRFIDNLSYVIELLIHKKSIEIGKSHISLLQNYLQSLDDDLNLSRYSLRKREIVNALMHGTEDEVLSLLKPRLLIAGHDLKFILNVKQNLSDVYSIDIDEWSSHNGHCEEASREKLNWADYIWCEWLLGNAVWYSKNKLPHQKLVVRMHRFELGFPYADEVDLNNVDAIISVCVLYFEKLLERLPSLPRSKVRLIPLGYDLDTYASSDDKNKLKNIAMIGILPSKKGLHLALRILNRLNTHSNSYSLHIYGKQPKDLSWIFNDKNEMKYYNDCEKYIEDNELSDMITYHGHVDIKTALEKDRIGFVLSLSSSVPGIPGFEAFHTAVGDGYAAGCLSLIKHYHGCEFVWPNKHIYANYEQISDQIVKYNKDNFAEFQRNAIGASSFVQKNYTNAAFVKRVVKMFKSI